MKLNKDIFLVRNQIVNSFCIPPRHLPLVASDKADHKCRLEEVYKGMLREADVVDKCCWRFEKMFGWN